MNPNSNQQNRFWLCQCDCGIRKVINYKYLINEKVKSCGCLRQDRQLLKTIAYA